MAFVEKLQPVEKVDLSDVEIGTLSSDKILEVTSLQRRKGHNRGSFVEKWKVSGLM